MTARNDRGQFIKDEPRQLPPLEQRTPGVADQIKRALEPLQHNSSTANSEPFELGYATDRYPYFLRLLVPTFLYE